MRDELQERRRARELQQRASDEANVLMRLGEEMGTLTTSMQEVSEKFVESHERLKKFDEWAHSKGLHDPPFDHMGHVLQSIVCPLIANGQLTPEEVERFVVMMSAIALCDSDELPPLPSDRHDCAMGYYLGVLESIFCEFVAMYAQARATPEEVADIAYAFVELSHCCPRPGHPLGSK